jgi:hypothetical protein
VGPCQCASLILDPRLTLALRLHAPAGIAYESEEAVSLCICLMIGPLQKLKCVRDGAQKGRARLALPSMTAAGIACAVADNPGMLLPMSEWRRMARSFNRS